MYNITRFCLMVTGLLTSSTIFAQTVITFEEFEIGVDTFWDGSDQSGGFMSEAVFFPNVYNPDFGGYWESGWVLSNRVDSVTSGYLNIFSAKTATGYDGSPNYVLGQQNSQFNLTEELQGTTINGLYITNTTYAHNSMRDGDGFAKKFGGETGQDPDFFKLTIKKWRNGEIGTDSVDFYLADYRFDDNSMDYIVDTWQWVDLTSLGDVDSLFFTLDSTDGDEFGIFTPSFFAMDNLTLSGVSSVKKPEANDIKMSLYPNPVTEKVTLDWSQVSTENADISVFDATGQLVARWKNQETNSTFNVQHFVKGMYFIRVELKTFYVVKRLTVN